MKRTHVKKSERGRGRRRRSSSQPAPEQPAVDYSRLLACVRRAAEPVTVPGLVRMLELEPEDEPALRRQMELLEKQGVVFSQRRGRWSMHSRARATIGRVSSPRRTFGFVVPESGAGPHLYVSGWNMHGARHGDLVLARSLAPRSRQRQSTGSAQGEILAVLERRPPFVAGLFYGDARGGIVVPRDERVSGDVAVGPPPTEGLPGGTLADGMVVWAEVTSPEDRFRPARGRLIEVLGRPADPGVDIAVIQRTYDLPGGFPPEAEREASSHGASVGPEERSGREDFTCRTVITVDPATAKDHDDAVGLERLDTPRGPFYRLAVHIADVSHYVPEGGAVDREALRRGTSVYFPGSSIPMLPASLSSGLSSLVPGEERLVQSVIMDFDAQGGQMGYRFADGVILSAASITYDDVAGILLRGGGGHPHAGMLREMERLCGALRSRRMARGSLDLNLPETEVLVDEEGRPLEVRALEHTIAHQIIEEFMLAANETVARYLTERMSLSLYRIHEDPDPAGIDEVEEELIQMGYPIRRTRGPASARIKTILESFTGHPEEPAVAMMILRSLKLARYSHEVIGHFGLAAPLYTHYTSPIRRYPDLVVHRILRQTRRPEWGPAKEGSEVERLASVALECSRLERRAEEAERAIQEWKMAVYMQDRIGEEFHGMVTGETASRVFVALDGLGVEGMVPKRARTDEQKGRRRGREGRRDEGSSTRSAWRLGNRLRVRVQDVDTFRARILLKPLSMG